MKLSICVPTYNRLDSLKVLLEELKKISFDSFEIIINDDSTNNLTRDFFKNNSIPHVKYHKNFTNLGQFKNCNACIARAQGEWIQIAHDDDEIDPDYLSAVLPYLDDKEAVIITGKSVFHGKYAKETEIAHNQKLEKIGFTFPKLLEGEQLIMDILKFGTPFIFSHTIFRREIAIAHGSFNTELRMIGDADLWLRILRSGKCRLVDKVFGRYILHDSNQLSGDGHFHIFVELLCQKIAYLKHFKTHATPDEYGDYLNYIRKKIPRALFVTNKVLNHPVLYARLQQLIAQHSLTPYFDGKSAFFYTLYHLPRPFALKTFHIALDRKNKE